MPDSRPSRRARQSVAGVIFAVGALLTAIAVGRCASNNRRTERERFDAQGQQLVERLAARMAMYEYGLRGARGVLLAIGPDRFDRKLFRAYHESRDLSREFPGAHGYGFIRRVAYEDAAVFVAEAQRDDAPDFALHQFASHDGERDVILYVEPVEINKRALGLDIASEDNRRTAARQSLRLGRATLTAPIALIQSGATRSRAFLLLLPIYRHGMPIATPEQRDAACYGWSFAPLAIEEVLADFELQDDAIALRLADASATSAPFLEATGFERAGADELTATVERPVFGRQWRVEMRARQRLVDELNLFAPFDVAVIGGVTSLLLAALGYASVLGGQRARMVHRERARLVAIVENSSDAIIAESLDGVVTSWNHAAETILGHAVADALGKRLTDLVPQDRAADEAELEARVRGGEVWPAIDTVWQRGDGTAIDVSIGTAPITAHDGTVIGIGRTIRDITSRKAAERQLRELNTSLEQQVHERTTALETANHTLEATHHDLQTLLNALPSMIGYWDTDQINRFANRAYEEWFLVAPGQLPGHHLHDVLSPELYALVLPRFQAAMNGEPQTFEREIPPRDGKPKRHALAHYIPDHYQGAVRGVFVLVHDVTELTESKLKLAAANRNNQAMLATLHQLTMVSVADRDGLIRDANDAFCRRSGYTWAELNGQDHRIINSGFHPPEFWQAMWGTIASGKPWRGEICNRAKDGAVYWVDCMIAPIYAESGEIERYVSIRTDITQSKAMVNELARERERLDNILRATNVGSWEWNLSTGEAHVDERWAQLMGYARAELEPISIQTLVDHVNSDDLEASQPQLARHVRGDLPYHSVELRMRHRDGHWVWTQVRGRITTWRDGKPEWMYGTQQDITERRHADEALHRAMAAAEAASAAKSAFLANMSHEIRTPLNAVIGLSYLLEQSDLTAEQRSYCAKIQVAGRSLLGVINDVLDLSKIEAGEMALEDAPFTIDELLREIVALMAAQIEAKGLELRVEATADLPAVHGDPTRLRQILINLIANATKFTERGHIELRVWCVQRDATTATLQFSVRDTGIGIARELQDRLFMPFSQADASTTRQFGGTGLGLSIVRRLAQMMGGQVGVESEPGVGSTFWVTVVLGTSAASATARATALDLVEILIAEDDPDQRGHLLGMARALGWRVEAVESGDRLVERVTERIDAGSPPDAILVDWRMPGTDGFTALDVLARTIGHERMPAVLVISAHDVDTVRRAEHAELADAVLAKPITSSKLFDSVNSTTARRGRRRKLSSMELPNAGIWRLPEVRVLVVDDSEINLEVARRILAAEGAIVSECTNGGGAVELLRQRPGDFDVVLMDVQMPVMDGNEATREIRTQLGLQNLPIIALTAGALLAERQRTLDAGMNAFLSKPLDPHALIQTVHRYAQISRGAAIEPVKRGTTAPLPIAPAPAIEWPAIPGIEIAQVADRLDGDLSLFLTMLGYMIHEFVDLAVPPSVDTPGLAARLHKLRGSAGTLSANAVHRLATAAEQAVKRTPGDAETASLLQQLAAAVSSLIDHARPVVAASRGAASEAAREFADATRTHGGAAPLDPGAIRALGELLDQQDLAAIDSVRELAPALRAAWGEARARELTEAVERLEFTRAAALVASA